MNRQTIIEHCDNLTKLISLETACFSGDPKRDAEIKDAIRLWLDTRVTFEVNGILEEVLTGREMYDRVRRSLPDFAKDDLIEELAARLSDDQLKEVLKR